MKPGGGGFKPGSVCTPYLSRGEADVRELEKERSAHLLGRVRHNLVVEECILTFSDSTMFQVESNVIIFTIKVSNRARFQKLG